MQKEQTCKMSLPAFALLFCLFSTVTSGNVGHKHEASDLPEPFTYSSFELDNWKAPKRIRELTPYVLSGMDKKGNPVYYAELNKWAFFELTVTEEDRELFQKVFEQFIYRVGGNSSWSDSTRGVILIDQAENLDVKQLSGPYTIPFWIRGIQLLEGLAAKYNNDIKSISINANCVKRTLVGIVGLATGSILKNAELFGTNKTEWSTRLQELILREEIPEVLGGSSTWTYVKSHQD